MGVRGRRRAGSTSAGRGARAPRGSAAADYARKAGWSGAVFAVLLLAALLVSRIPGLAAPDAEYSSFYGHGGAATITVVGLYIVPLAGIACLWHMIATRTLIQVRWGG